MFKLFSVSQEGIPECDKLTTAWTVQAIAVHGVLRTRTPLKLLASNTLPLTGSRMVGAIPKEGTVTEPGFVSTGPGSDVVIIGPVSVCL